jgi:hypothetical protein
MATIDQPLAGSGSITNILDVERIIATAGFNRWLVPPAALCIHLCIGMAYGFSVFWLPLSRAIGLTAPKACPDMSQGSLYKDHPKMRKILRNLRPSKRHAACPLYRKGPLLAGLCRRPAALKVLK